MASISLDFMCFNPDTLSSKVSVFKLSTSSSKQFKMMPLGISINNHGTQVALYDDKSILVINMPSKYSKEQMISRDLAKLDQPQSSSNVIKDCMFYQTSFKLKSVTYNQNSGSHILITT